MEAPDRNDWSRDDSWCLDMAAVILGGIGITAYGAYLLSRRIASGLR